MPLDRARLKALYQRCNPEESLAPSDDRYVDLDAAEDDDAGPRGERWTTLLAERIEFADERTNAATLQLFSGLPGTGKSTELARLASYLDARGYLVAMVDVDQRLDRHTELGIAAMLLLMLYDAEAAVLACEGSSLADGASGGHVERMRRWALPTDLSARFGPEFAVADAHALNQRVVEQFRTETPLGRAVRDAFGARPAAFLDEINAAFADLRARARAAGRRDLVVIVDSLEHLQPAPSAFDEVIDSATRLFDGDMIKLPTHTLYTVPPSVVLRLKREVTFIPMVKLFPREAPYEKHEPGYVVLREVVRRRLGDEAIGELFGDQAERSVDELIMSSGGYPRALLAPIQEILVRAREGVVPAVSPKVFERILKRSGAQLETLVNYEGEAAIQLLRDVHRTGDIRMPDDDQAPMRRRLAARLLDLRALLRYQNDTGWWGAHPWLRSLLT